ncbi:uncharacterized protein LOC118764671 [Octopus sinensis]|uniref:Uncharacterized protein LOC118764671 n=1 Tax=Octopus sinensis TaxID=2607531 RepID=A0A7E6F240_9MOLL|nr:uncharacterized protein LOC118764671 [Octopus sinensis]
MDKITYINRGKKYGTVEVRFTSEEVAKKLSMEPIKAEDIVLLPLYKGKRTSKITMNNIPPEADAEVLVAAVMVGLEEKINILQATVEEEEFWKGQKIIIAIQAEVQTLEEIPETLKISEDERVTVFVEGRKPRCFGCGKKGHVRAECQPQPKPQEAAQPSGKEEAVSSETALVGPGGTTEGVEVTEAAEPTEEEKKSEETKKEEGWPEGLRTDKVRIFP